MIKEKEKNEEKIEKYIKLLWQPFLITLIFELASLLAKNSGTLIIVANIFLLLYITFKLKIVNQKEAAWLGGILIFLLTLIVAIAKLFINWKFYYIFNIITEPIIYAAGGALMAKVIILIKNNINKKGGDLNDTNNSNNTTK